MDDQLRTGRANGSPFSRRRLVAVIAGLAVVLGATGAALTATTDRGEAARAHRDDPTLPARGLAAPSTVASSPTTATPTTPALAVPEDPPTDPYAKVPIVRIGEIEIPKIGLRHPVFEGIWLTVIDQGPGHWPGTPRPGGYGNVVFAGHRVTHTRPFRNIDQLVRGDEVIFRMDDGVVARYHVTGSEVVLPSETHIVDQQPGHTLTLFACHPPGSASHRYVVHAELETAPTAVSSAPTPAPATASS